MLKTIDGITILHPAIHANLLRHNPTRRSYYLDIKADGQFAMHDMTTRYTMLAKVHDNARWMSVGIGKAGIVVVHSCRWTFNDIIGFWFDGQYTALRMNSGDRRGRNAIYMQHMHGKTIAAVEA
jgi:hypothetical protein